MKSVGIVSILKAGGVGVLPTDTLYGIVGSALSRKAVQRIYKLRRRNPKKPVIVLIGSVSDARTFGARLSPKSSVLCSLLWPGKVSIILPVRGKKFSYLHRGTHTIALRLPRPRWLRALLKKTGPLVAPSANWEDHPPARTIREAKRYCDDRVDFYIDKGRRAGKPSTLVKIEKGRVIVLREGAVKVLKM